MTRPKLEASDEEIQCVKCVYFYARGKFTNYFRDSFIEYVCKNKSINPNKEIRLYPEKGMSHISCCEYLEKRKKKGNES